MAAAKRSIKLVINNTPMNSTFINSELIHLLLHHPDNRLKSSKDVEYLKIKYHKSYSSTKALFLKQKGA